MSGIVTYTCGNVKFSAFKGTDGLFYAVRSDRRVISVGYKDKSTAIAHVKSMWENFAYLN